MMRWSCQRLHGCVPVEAIATPCASTSAPSCRRRSAMRSAATAKVSQRPVLTSISEEMSSPTRCSSSSVPAAASFSSSKRPVSSSVSGSSSWNSSSTATVMSSAFSNASRAKAICSSGVSFCASPTQLSYLKRLQEPLRDASPTPEFDGRAARRVRKRGVLVSGKREQCLQPAGEIACVARRESGEGPERRRVLRFESGGDLCQAGMSRHDRRRAGCRGLRCDHAERLREDRRNNRRVCERQQMHEMSMLERSREQRARRCEAFELVAVIAEADDHGARVDVGERLQEHVDALVVEELAEIQHGRLVRFEEARKTCRVVRVGQAMIGIVRIRGICTRLFEQTRERLVARLRTELVDVDTRRDLVDAVDVTDELLENRANVRGADEHHVRFGERLAPPGGELVVAAYRVLELGAVRLDRVP